jgi:hypothetical protein
MKMMIENIITGIQYIEDNLTLKNDYTEEIEIIKGMKDSIETLSHHQWNTPKWKIQKANEKADNAIKWMIEEMGARQ